MKLLGVFLFVLFAGSVMAQDIPDLQLQDVRGNELNLTERQGKWLLLTASEAGCSFTHTGVDRLFQQFENNEQLDVVVLDYENEARTQEIYADFLQANNFYFIASSEAVKTAFKKNYSPQYVLYNPNGEAVWKAKGLKKLKLEKIKAAMK